MALIEVYHVVADFYPVSPTTNPLILEGNLVALTTSADQPQVILDPGANAAIGIAGDTSHGDAGSTPYSAALVINSAGATRFTQNRVSDYFDETAASNKCTVYNGGGKFSSDRFVTTDNFVIGDPLYSNGAGLLTRTAGGLTQVVARLTNTPHAEPSGVPGVDTVDNNTSLGTFITFVLLI